MLNQLRTALICAIIITIPLNQVLAFTVFGVTIKLYHALLVLLMGVGCFDLREGKSLAAWQKFGLVFLACSALSFLAGRLALMTISTLPELPAYMASAMSNPALLFFFLVADVWFAYSVVRLIGESESGLDDVLRWATYSAFIPTLYGIYQIIGFAFSFQIEWLEFSRLVERPDAPRGIFLDSGFLRIASTYFEPSPYGAYLGIVLPLIVARLARLPAESPRERKITWLALVLVLLNIMLCFSTVGVLSVIVFFLVLAWLRGAFWRWTWRMAGIIGFGVVILALFGFGETVWTFFDSFIIQKLTAESGSVYAASRDDRLRQVEIALALAAKFPLFGVGEFMPFFYELENTASAARAGTGIAMLYALIPAQNGLVGTLVFTGFLGWLAFALHGARKHDTEINLTGDTLLALLAALLILFFAFGSLLPLQLWLALGVMIGYIERCRKP
jgi:hypothetical protein